MSQKFTLQINAPGFENLVGDELVGFRFIESLDGCARWSLIFETQSVSRYDSFIKNDEKPFTLRFGTQMNTSGSMRSNLKTLRTLQSTKNLSGNAKVLYSFKGTCNGIQVQKHRAKNKHWKERKISQIVDELISESFSDLFVKVAETEGKFSLMGCNEPTGSFIRNELMPYAFSNKGNDWRFWVQDGKTVRFEPTTPEGDTVKFTNLFRSGWTTIKNPKIIKDTRFDAELRTGKIEVVMYDPDRKRLIRQEIGENNGDFNYASSGRPRERKHVSETIRVQRLQDRQTDLPSRQLVRKVGQNLWGHHGRSLYKIMAQCDFEPGLTVNRPAYVDLAGPFGATDVNSGTWVISEVKHDYSRGSTKSFVVLEKRWER